VTRYCLFDTAIGPCGVAWSVLGLARLQLPESDRAATERRLKRYAGGAADDAPAAIVHLIGELRRYLAGERVDFASVAVDLGAGGPFEQKVYEAARLIRWGDTASYGEIAQRIGTPQAARAVGQALGRNPVPIIVPCHRILAKGRRIGGFSAHGGTRTKERLLALEGVHIAPDAPRLPGLD
jgi:methylated-DNA-[protein]-cysteine S-methyltransferase